MTEQTLNKNTLDKLNALLACDPTKCTGTQCPNYFEEHHCCDAERVISMINTILKMKFEGVKTYNYES